MEGQWAYLALGAPEMRNGRGKVICKAVPPDKTMLIFMLKTRYGYREVVKNEHSGFENLNLRDLTDAQLDQLTERLTGAIASRTEHREDELEETLGGKVH